MEGRERTWLAFREGFMDAISLFDVGEMQSLPLSPAELAERWQLRRSEEGLVIELDDQAHKRS